MSVRDAGEWLGTLLRDMSRTVADQTANLVARIDLHLNAPALVSDLERRNGRLNNQLALYRERDERWRAKLAAANRTITHQEERMTSLENALADESAANNELRSLIGRIAAEHQSVLNQLTAAQANAATAGAEAQQVITDDAIADAERTRNLIGELVAAFPGAIPAVTIPAPGEPAEVPVVPAELVADPVADGGTESPSA